MTTRPSSVAATPVCNRAPDLRQPPAADQQPRQPWLTLGYAITPWLDVSASAIRATSIVGFDDLFGLATVDHRIYATTVGVELLAEKKGLLRSELMFMDAQAQPQANVNQGQIPDAEKSRGFGVRLLSTDPDGRWKADAMWARSRYVNPTHPDLAQGSTLVAVAGDARRLSGGGVLPAGEGRQVAG